MPNWTKEQKEAIEKDGQSIIVSAGAGSGKTAVLSERVIRKLKQGVNIDELLILTFTKAAAAEMKERIRKKIKENSSLKEQLDRIDNAYITTFDSYALSIVKKYSYLLNVSKNISIVEQSIIEIKKNEILDKIFLDLYEKKEETFLNLIDTFCTKDDFEIKEYVMAINNKLDMIYNKDLYLNNFVKDFYNGELIDKKIKEYEELLFDKISELNMYYIELEEYVESDYYEKLTEILDNLIIAKDYLDVKKSIVKLPMLPKGSTNEAKDLKDKISNILKELSNLTIYVDTDEMKKSIYNTKNYVEAILMIIKEFDKQINDYKYENELYEFNDIAKMAIKVLDINPKIKDEIKYSLNEIMIDEYQDTSDLQDKFISLIENNNVYMVGDIKQSIYRFRNANPNLFKEKYNNYSKELGGTKIDLNKNFRSREEVLFDINLIFDNIMDDNIGGADYSKTHRMIFGNESYNEIGKTGQSNNLEVLTYNLDDALNFKKEEIEIFLIANDIKNKIENDYKIYDKDNEIIKKLEYKDIVILMDRSTNFNLYKKIFEYLNIPLSVYKDESIIENVDILLLKNILSLIINRTINKDFKYAFTSIMRSYLFEKDDNEIFQYFIKNNFYQSELYKMTNIKYDELTPKEIVDLIILKFDFYNKIISVGDIDKHIAIIDYVQDIASSLTNMGYTVDDFYAYLEEIINKNYDIVIPSKIEENGVKIMTIHKSKGLEYHLCYYSGLYAKFNTGDLKEKFIYDNDYGIIVPYYEDGIRNTFYKELLKRKYLKEEISEKIRLFYVALTRAKEKMIIVCPNLNETNLNQFVPNYVRLKYRSFLDIITSIGNIISNYKKEVDIKKIGLTKNYNYIKKTNYKDSIEKCSITLNVNELNSINEYMESKHFSKSTHSIINKSQNDNIKFGIKFHNILENIDFKNPNYSGLEEFEKKKIQAFIENPILNNYIECYKEHEFIYTDDNISYHGIIDLLLEFKDDFKIIDYKLSNITDELYVNQLKGYKNYIEKLTSKKTKIYLYSIIDEKLEEIID